MLRYLNGSLSLGLVSSKTEANQIDIKGYCDVDYAIDLDRWRSLTGYTFTLGGNLISWKSTLQHTVALSITKVEYVALIEAIKEAMWLKGITNERGLMAAW